MTSSFSSSLAIAQPNPDGSLPVPAAAGAAGPSAAQWQERAEHLQAQVDSLQEILAKPLNEILADCEKSQEAAAAWDAFGAMWMLSQRAMRRVALELATAQGVTEAEVVARALRYANEVLNGDGENLGGTLAEAQMAHIERHKPFLRKQFR
jgi:predicted dienelactone hydrolase